MQRCTRPQLRLRSSRVALVVSQRKLGASQVALAAAARLDAQMQARLQAAETELAQARVDLAKAKAAVVEQRAEIGELAASNYANGDPSLMGLAVILNSQDPASVTSQLNTVSSLMSKQTMMLSRLRAARAQTALEESRVATATTAVAAQRKLAAANLVTKQALERNAATARAEYATMVARNRAATVAAARARRADLRQLHSLKKQEQRIKDLILARAARQHGGYHGATGGLLLRPVPGYVTSPFGWRIHPIYHYWGLHDGTDFHAPCGTRRARVRRGHGHRRVLVRRLRPPALPRPRADQRQELHRRLQPPLGVPHPHRPARTSWADGRPRRHHGLVHRVPPALHRAGRRHAREPDELHRRLKPVARGWETSGMPKEKGRKLIAQNRRARYDYHVEDVVEAGLALVGTEVKSLRAGRATLGDGFAEIHEGEVFLHGVHIPEYTQGTWTNHEPRRVRKLLMHRHEIDKLESKVNERGFTLVPLSLYFKDGRAKVEIALAKGKKTYDKRQSLAARQAKREKDQALGRRLKGDV